MLRKSDLHTDPVLARKIRRIQQSRMRAASEEEEDEEQASANRHSLLIPSDGTEDIDDVDSDGVPVDVKQERIKRERSVAAGNAVARESLGTTATQSIVVDLGDSTEDDGEGREREEEMEEVEEVEGEDLEGDDAEDAGEDYDDDDDDD